MCPTFSLFPLSSLSPLLHTSNWNTPGEAFAQHTCAYLRPATSREKESAAHAQRPPALLRPLLSSSNVRAWWPASLCRRSGGLHVHTDEERPPARPQRAMRARSGATIHRKKSRGTWVPRTRSGGGAGAGRPLFVVRVRLFSCTDMGVYCLRRVSGGGNRTGCRWSRGLCST